MTECRVDAKVATISLLTALNAATTCRNFSMDAKPAPSGGGHTGWAWPTEDQNPFGACMAATPPGKQRAVGGAAVKALDWMCAKARFWIMAQELSRVMC